MANQPDAPAPFSLRRWSQRKTEAAREAAVKHDGATGTPAAVSPGSPPLSAGAPPAVVPAVVPVATNTAASPSAGAEPPLPPVDTLTIDSDFAPFLQPRVAEDVKRAALKKLFSDPQFNVMDGLDIYVGDYTQPDPMPAGMLDKLGKVYGMLEKSEPVEITDGAPPTVDAGTASAPAQPDTAAEDARDAAADATVAAPAVEIIPREADADSADAQAARSTPELAGGKPLPHGAAAPGPASTKSHIAATVVAPAAKPSSR